MLRSDKAARHRAVDIAIGNRHIYSRPGHNHIFLSVAANALLDSRFSILGSLVLEPVMSRVVVSFSSGGFSLSVFAQMSF